MKTSLWILCWLTISSLGHAQVVVPGNLVPNPGFEYLNSRPTRWMLNKWDFEAVMQRWTSPNLGSPDVLTEETMYRLRPPRPKVDLSGYHPRSGRGMVGIKTWGCGNRITHCKEFLQVKLTEPLVEGHTYDLVLWVGVLQNSVKTNNLGFGLSQQAISDTSELTVMDIIPIHYFKEIIAPGLNEWIPLRCRFQAPKGSQYLLIGNFFPDDATQVDSSSANLPYAYYFIDDVLLREVNLFDLLDSVDIGETTIEFDAIFFELDKAELLPASHSPLLQLADWLKRHPQSRIEISGHTDSSADDAYNLDLSRRRAETVANFLISCGIAPHRLVVVGRGEHFPVISNDTEEGRSRNRRVEFRIIE